MVPAKFLELNKKAFQLGKNANLRSLAGRVTILLVGAGAPWALWGATG